MKLLSVAIPHHDVNMSYFDGETVRYLKLERTRQEKRFNFRDLRKWKREAQNLWNIDVDEIEDVAFTFDPASLPESLRGAITTEALVRLTLDQSKAEEIPPRVCEYLGVRKGWLVSHHYLHALSTWMIEPAAPAVHIVIDGIGDGRPWSIYRNEKLVALGHIKNGSIGWGIRDAGKLLEVRYGHYNDIAGKVMGLQSFGRIDKVYLDYLRRFDFGKLKDLWSVKHWHAHKKDSLVGKLTLLDWVATVHCRTGEMILDLFRQFAQPQETISYSGGVAQNVIWNALLKAHFPNLVIPPHSSDEGLSLGGIEWLRRKHGLPKFAMPGFPFAQSDTAVPAPSDETVDRAAQWLAQGKVVGWYQGHGEIGPRALGNRSILMDPRIRQGKDLLNRVKQREHYRPFGATVLKQHYDDYFEGPSDAGMLYACQVKSGEFPAITHVDNSCRVQVLGDENPDFKRLLTRFFAIIGCPILANTSLNLAGKPIAANPETALELFATTALDAIVIGDEVHLK